MPHAAFQRVCPGCIHQSFASHQRSLFVGVGVGGGVWRCEEGCGGIMKRGMHVWEEVCGRIGKGDVCVGGGP